MYTVVEFNLPDGLNVIRKDHVDFARYNEDRYSQSSVAKMLAIEVPDSGGQVINLMKYVVGERITFRKSLTGLKLIRGLPDYTGSVAHVDLVGKIPTMVTKLKNRYQERQAAIGRLSNIPQNNLCMEIPIGEPHDWSTGIDWASLTSARDARVDDNRRTLGELMADQLRDMTNRDGFTRTLAGTGTVTGRATGPRVSTTEDMMRAAMLESATHGIQSLYHQRAGRPGRSQSIEEASRRYTNRFWADFDGDTRMTQALLSSIHSEAPRTMAMEDQPAPRYVDNRYEITEVDLAGAIRATAEVVQGERGRPPASRGPRPRNQRW